MNTSNTFAFIQNRVISLTKNFFAKNTNVEVHQDRDLISLVKYSDNHFFTSVIFLTSISPCET